jgi:hypothetical protein
MGMLQAGGELDLTQETIGAEGLGQLRMEHLERHGTFVAEIVRQVHHGHAATAELALDAVAVCQSRLKAIQDIGHEAPSIRDGSER